MPHSFTRAAHAELKGSFLLLLLDFLKNFFVIIRNYFPSPQPWRARPSAGFTATATAARFSEKVMLWFLQTTCFGQIQDTTMKHMLWFVCLFVYFFFSSGSISILLCTPGGHVITRCTWFLVHAEPDRLSTRNTGKETKRTANWLVLNFLLDCFFWVFGQQVLMLWWD